MSGGRTREVAATALALAAWLFIVFPVSAATSPFNDWAAVVVAGDWHAHGGGETEAFDNARRDVSRALLSAGFQTQNLREFSTRPQRYKPRPGKSDIEGVYDALSALAARAPDGCLVYFTSHGAPEGVVVADQLLAPGVLGAMLDQACGARPTIAVISACFSGVFVPELAAPNRMVLTAARPDRTSFGCGESNRYPYFDDCFLSVFPNARDFPHLGAAVQACVARREIETGAKPPSEPQLAVGAAVRPILPLYPLPAGVVRSAAH